MFIVSVFLNKNISVVRSWRKGGLMLMSCSSLCIRLIQAHLIKGAQPGTTDGLCGDTVHLVKHGHSLSCFCTKTLTNFYVLSPKSNQSYLKTLNLKSRSKPPDSFLLYLPNTGPPWTSLSQRLETVKISFLLLSRDLKVKRADKVKMASYIRGYQLCSALLPFRGCTWGLSLNV